MIFAASLAAPIKKAYGEKAMATTVQNIISQMNLDPKLSQMDACVLGVKDVKGINRAKVQAALRTKHPDVCVIYIYSSDKEGELIDAPFKELLKKISADSMRSVIDKFLGEQNVRSTQVTTPIREMAATQVERKEESRRMLGTSVKGEALKKAAQPDEVSTSSVILHDDVLNLDYKTDIFGTRTYLNTNGEVMSPAQVLAHKEKVTAKKEEEERKAAEELARKRELEKQDPFMAPKEDIQVNLHKKDPKAAPMKEVTKVVYVDSNGNEVTKNHPDARPVEKKVMVPNEEYQPSVTPKAAVNRAESQLEKNIQSIEDFHDWGYFQTALKKDTIVRELLEENATYQGVVQMLNVLDTDIKGVYYDRGLSADQKFEKIMEIGGKRAQLMATQNDIISKKVIDIIDTITISARRTVEDLLAQHRDALEILNKQDMHLADESQIDNLIQKRNAIIVELLAAYRSIVQVLQVMNVEVRDIIVGLDANLPSSNEFINQMVGAATSICIPTNTSEIAKKLMDKIMEVGSSKPGSLSALGQYLWDFIDSSITLLQTDEDIITKQQSLIRLLKSHRVEDVVVIDGVLKKILQVYIGSDATGRTATTLTWAGCLARRRNTLLIDFTPNSKLKDYGVAPIDLHEFINQRIDKPLCVVAGQPTDMEELSEIIKELKTRLDYYANILVVFDDTQIDYARVASDEGNSINFITNCTNDSISTIKECYAAITIENVARKLLLIDPPVSVLELAKRANVDVLTTRCVTIPAVQRVKTCSIMHDAPYEYTEVRSIYEEAFR